MHSSVALRIAKVTAALALMVPLALTARTPCRFAVSHQQMVAGTSILDQAYRWFVSVLPWSSPGTEPRPLQRAPARPVKPLTTCTIDPSGGCVSSNIPASIQSAKNSCPDRDAPGGACAIGPGGGGRGVLPRLALLAAADAFEEAGGVFHALHHFFLQAFAAAQASGVGQDAAGAVFFSGS